ncbi:tissue factor-like isoform X2 [Echeneis naucrates]|nr:tissue factor-like isoform X2 [Echeneis naucrates]
MSKASNNTYTVQFSQVDESHWHDTQDCTQVSETECDLSNLLIPFNRTYQADIQTEPETMSNNADPHDFPHIYSPKFNPYRESNISAVTFTVETVDKNTVRVNITDPLTSIHQNGRQLSIRDILNKDLMYKISFYKSGNTGKRDIISDSSVAEVKNLDEGYSYCFMVAAYIPSRPKSTQQGAWSTQCCTKKDETFLPELSLGAWVGVVFILVTVLIIIITVTVLCCRCCQRRKILHTTQSSVAI